MTGPARLSFHAVPRILHADPDYIQASFNTDSERNTQHSLSMNGNHNCKDFNELSFQFKDIIDTSNSNNGEANSSVRQNGSLDDKNRKSNIRTENACICETESDTKTFSDQEIEKDDPYSMPSGKNMSIDLRKENCDNEANDVSDKLTSLSSPGGNCELSDLKSLMDRVIRETDWTPFAKYLNQSRINVNVRKVLIEGESLPISPEVIPKCPGKKQ